MQNNRNRTRGDLLVLLAALIWGVAFYFQKTAMLHIGPLLFLGLRSAVAVTVLLPFVFYEQKYSVEKNGSVFPIGLLGGVIFFFAGSIQQFGIVSATVINTGVLTALYIVFTPLAYWLVKREAPSFHVWLSVGLAFTGVWLLSSATIGGFSNGDLLIAGSTLLWGLGFVVAGEAGKYGQPLTYTCVQFGLVSALAMPLAFATETFSLSAIIEGADSILYVGILSSAFTFALMAMALRHITAPRASILLSSEVVFSVAAGYLFLGERLALVGWVGATLIVAAVVYTRLKSD